MGSGALAVLLNVGGAVVGGLITYWVYEWYKGRTYVKRISKVDDKDIDGFLDLYDRLFDESVRLSPEEILRWIEQDRLGGRGKSRIRRDYLLVCKIGDKVVGFLKAIYSYRSRYMFVAYYGVDKRSPQARAIASTVLVRALLKLVQRDIKDCQGLVFEVEAPDPSLAKSENARRKARIRLFKEVARRWHYRVYGIGITYLQPEMPTDPGEVAEETRLELLYLPLGQNVRRGSLTKAQVINILQFIYLEIYSPSFEGDPGRHEQYQLYLRSLLRRYESGLHRRVPLIL